MKIRILSSLCLLIVFLGGCTVNEEDFISKYCPGSCTVIKGRITATDGTPLADVPLTLNWENRGTFGIFGVSRKKDVTRTDANGNYELRFLLRDKELEDGYLQLLAAVDRSRYFSCKFEQPKYTFYDLGRDTSVVADIQIPYKATVALQLNNKQDIHINDAFSSYFRSGDCGQVVNWAGETPLAETIAVAADVPTIVVTSKMKDGVETAQTDTLLLSAGEKFTYTAQF
jgi:hypothetical protein